MRFRRRGGKILSEPESTASGDIAFNLIVFFLVCASSAPDSGRKQDLPRAESKQEQKQQSENVEVLVDRTSQSINGVRVSDVRFVPELKSKLRAKSRPEDRIVVVKSDKATPYDQWVKITGWVEDAGGVVTLQMAEEKTVMIE